MALGIYPVLARFVKPISVPMGDCEVLFFLRNESGRKLNDLKASFFKKKISSTSQYHWHL